MNRLNRCSAKDFIKRFEEWTDADIFMVNTWTSNIYVNIFVQLVLDVFNVGLNSWICKQKFKEIKRNQPILVSTKKIFIWRISWSNKKNTYVLISLLATRGFFSCRLNFKSMLWQDIKVMFWHYAQEFYRKNSDMTVIHVLQFIKE